ncbi:DUF2474 family protein [Methylorubrum suomiense]|uniref:DUF2474 domain-containing protein n=1 Tax=Methylorubrum suomiense TaxID=144191 RepID=A0ABQ4UXV7_9HYPH|nr:MULTISPECIES: DUF2474 family protein [Methylobacteriaceae]GJE77156.1 hypothetical protein BGCPKDLD_3759 [Methylorubrum suomiense]
MGTASTPQHQAPLWRRLLWFAALWIGSVVSLGAVAFVLRAWLKAG